jgi:hypothetical protein
MWFGTYEKMQDVKCTLSELPVSSQGFSSTINFRNGGADVVRSWGSHKEFDMSWKGTMDEVGPFLDYGDGLYGTGLLYFALPAAMRRNLFSPNWAAPRLVHLETNGWPHIYDDTASAIFTTTAANSYNQPLESVTYTTVASVPSRKFVIPVPPTMTLHLGWSGSRTSTGAVYYRPVNGPNDYDTATALTALSPTGSTRLNTTIDGSSCVAVEIYLSGAGTVTVASLMAQLWPTGYSPSLTGLFKSGRGYSGFKFEDTPSYSVVQDAGTAAKPRERYSMSATLVEVGQWQPL